MFASRGREMPGIVKVRQTVNTTRRKAKKTVRLPAKVLARYRCNDCGVNVVTAGEFYMLHLSIWEDQLGLGWNDNICIGCLEARLGRKVCFDDMMTFPEYPWMKPMSIRLWHRLFGDLITKRRPYRLHKIVKDVSGFPKAFATAIGEYGAREADGMTVAEINRLIRAANCAARKEGAREVEIQIEDDWTLRIPASFTAMKAGKVNLRHTFV